MKRTGLLLVLALLLLMGCGEQAGPGTPVPPPSSGAATSAPMPTSDAAPSSEAVPSARPEEGWKRLERALPEPEGDFEPYAEPEFRDVAYKTCPDGVEPSLDILLPTRRVYAKNPVVFLIHGGGLNTGSKAAMEELYPEWIGLLRENGVMAVNLGYRLIDADTHMPACVVDCLDGMQWLADHAAAYDADVERMAVMGSSSGGQLAMVCAYNAESPWFAGEKERNFELRYCVDISGVPTLEYYGGMPEHDYARLLFDFTRPDVEDLARQISPLALFTNKLAKPGAGLLILTGDKDEIVGTEIAGVLAREARGAGIDAELLNVVNGGHDLRSFDGAAVADPPFDDVGRYAVYAILDRFGMLA